MGTTVKYMQEIYTYIAHFILTFQYTDLINGMNQCALVLNVTDHELTYKGKTQLFQRKRNSLFCNNFLFNDNMKSKLDKSI